MARKNGTDKPAQAPKSDKAKGPKGGAKPGAKKPGGAKRPAA